MQRTVAVGIMAEKNIEMVLHGNYTLDGEPVTGAVSLKARGFGAPMQFIPVSEDAYAEVRDVTIGVNFHWQRRETQCFKGIIKIVKDTDRIMTTSSDSDEADSLVLINILDIEDYLTSVISSEMSATSSPELLKAHAVISRSWLLAQIDKGAIGEQQKCNPTIDSTDNRETEMPSQHERHVVWYDHDDHTLFDVCADDHCQRYQGITRANTPQVVAAIDATRGQVLVDGDELCDARFSKCCGGVFEEFESCWQDTHKSYLIARRDFTDPADYPDLRIETEAVKWIQTAPNAFCNTDDARILRQVLNNYDQETADFYRWAVEYTDDELTDLLLRRSGIDFGKIIDMVPLRRGTSGRIFELRIIGEKRTVDVGKELEIRRWLSESHLYSSAFAVEKTETGFRLSGAGWGHGVGLCQIGAAVMADRGYDYRQILTHYYPGSEIKEI